VSGAGGGSGRSVPGLRGPLSERAVLSVAAGAENEENGVGCRWW